MSQKIYINKHNVHVLRKASTSKFVETNRKYITDTKTKIGASMKNATRYKGLHLEEEDSYLSIILNSDGRNVQWEGMKNAFWDGISKDVPESGLKLNVGFRYDLDKARSSKLGKQIIDNNKIKDAEELALLVESEVVKFDESNEPIGAVHEDQKYNFGFPLNVDDYVLWRYLLGYRDCARVPTLVNKSGHIRMYLKDDKIIKKETLAAYALRKSARLLFGEVLNDKEKMVNILVAANLYNRNLTTEDCEMAIETFKDTNVHQFIKLAKDKYLGTKANIERMVSLGILNRAENSTAIYNGLNEIIGTDMKRAVEYFNNPDLAPKTNQLMLNLKEAIATNK